MQAKPISTFPPVKQDLAFTVSTDVTAAELKQVIVDAAGSSLESIELFDVYTGDQLGEDEKSLAYAVTFRAPDKTLASEDSEAIRKRIVDEASKLGCAAARLIPTFPRTEDDYERTGAVSADQHRRT